MARHPASVSMLALLAAPLPLAAQVKGPATHICLAPTLVTEGSTEAAAAQGAVREGFTAYLAGPSLSTTPLSARLDSQVRAEAKAADCPFLLLTSVKQVHKKGGSSFLNSVVAGALSQGAYEAGASSGATAGRIAGNATSQAANQAAYRYATGVKDRDELTLGYRLENVAGATLLEKQEKRKATSDGEDLLTPMIQSAAEAIVAATTEGARP